MSPPSKDLSFHICIKSYTKLATCSATCLFDSSNVYINHISTHHPYITKHQSYAQGSFKSNSSVESKWLEPSKPPTTNNWSELRGVALQPLRQAFMPGPGLKVNLDLRSSPTEKTLDDHYITITCCCCCRFYSWCQHVVTLPRYNHIVASVQ